MCKVRVSAGYDTSENLTNRLLKQFKTSEDDIYNLDFVFDDSYDVVIFFNYINLPINNKVRSYLFPHEPSWSGTHQKNFTEIENVKVLGFDKRLYQPQTVCQETLSHTFYGGRGPWVDKLEDWNWEKVTTHSPHKTKNISSIVTNLNSENIDHNGCTYKVRFDLIDHLIKTTDYIDFFGGWGKMDDPEKKSAVENYRFCISIENQFTKNWITEKFYDCILYNCIPIYFGCENIKEIYPEDGYILIEDINNPEKVKEQLDYINNNAEKIYNEKISGLLGIKKRYFSEYNLLKIIKELSNEF